jgi:hypothetical protein
MKYETKISIRYFLESVLEINLPGISARFLSQSFSRRSGRFL